MATMYLLSSVVLSILYIVSAQSSDASGLKFEDIRRLSAGLNNAADILFAMRPESQTQYKRKHRSFLDAVKIITSFVRQQNSLPDNEQTSLIALIREVVIKDSCTWLQSELIGYDANFNCTLGELELLKLRIDLLRSLNLGSKAIKRSPVCASGCGSILETSNWLHGILPCGEATAARNALYNSFGDILSTRHIHIQPCSQSS